MEEKEITKLIENLQISENNENNENNENQADQNYINQTNNYFKLKKFIEIADSKFFTQKLQDFPGNQNSKIGYAYHTNMTLHKKKNHKERPQRIKAIDYHLKIQNLKQQLFHIEVEECCDEFLLHLHDEEYLCKIKENNEKQFTNFELNDDVYTNQYTRNASYLAAGAVKQSIDLICNDKLNQILCNIRPPGHHAFCFKDQPSGFCFFNNVAIGAKYALSKYSQQIKKVLIFDWDVHHGDGTQNAFYDDNQVLFISLHRYDNGTFYPSNSDGNFDKIGSKKGEGYNINIPWNTQDIDQQDDERYIIGDNEYIYIFDKILLPIIKEFKPDFIFISAGFDSAKGDPLGGLGVTPQTYAYIVHELLKVQNKIIVALEGGYNKQALSLCFEGVVRVLLNQKLPYQNIQIDALSWNQIRDNAVPKFFYTDIFLPKLIQLLSSQWQSMKDLLPEFEEKISNFDDLLEKRNQKCKQY